VLSVMLPAGKREFGVVVDSVSEVVDVGADRFKPTPDVGSGVNNEFIQGLATVQDRMVILLDVDRLIGRDFVELESAAPAAA
jgi:purine-binding chemotaxis protein CheW